MITFIAFALAIAGCINWLLIGLLQYDFVAGIFGYQGSVFSRIIYIVIGAAALYLVVKLFLDKGSIHVWGAKKKRLSQKKAEYQNLQPSNIEASRENIRRRESGYREHQHDEYGEYDYDRGYTRPREREYGQRQQSGENGLFDQHFDRK